MTQTTVNPPLSRPARRRFQAAPWLFALPVMVLLLVFTVYPIGQSLLLSFERNLDGVDKFVGTAQYQRLAGDSIFRTAAINTFVFFLMAVPLTLFLALGIAYLLNTPKFPLRGFFQSAYFLPSIMGLATAGILFRMLLNEQFGVVNGLLTAMGLAGVPWLSSPLWAKVSVTILLMWRAVGFNVLVYLAALQNVSPELYEAAELDGANEWQKFTRITLPSLQPIILFTFVMSTLATINLFDEVMVLTGGGPSDATLTLGLYLYRTAFQNIDYNYGSAIAWAIVIVAAAIAGLQTWAGRRAQ